MNETKIAHISTLHVGDILTFTSKQERKLPMSHVCLTTYEILEIYLGVFEFTGCIPMVKLTVTHAMNGNIGTSFVEDYPLSEIIDVVDNVVQRGEVVILERED